MLPGGLSFWPLYARLWKGTKLVWTEFTRDTHTVLKMTQNFIILPFPPPISPNSGISQFLDIINYWDFLIQAKKARPYTAGAHFPVPVVDHPGTGREHTSDNLCEQKGQKMIKSSSSQNKPQELCSFSYVQGKIRPWISINEGLVLKIQL